MDDAATFPRTIYHAAVDVVEGRSTTYSVPIGPARPTLAEASADLDAIKPHEPSAHVAERTRFF